MIPGMIVRRVKSRWPVLRSQFVTPVSKRHKSSRPEQPTRANEDVASKTIPVPNTVPTLPLWQRLGPLSTVLQAYARSQRARPLTTQLCSSLIIYFCGDLGAQYIGSDDYDPRRTLRALIIGVVCSIPSYRWYGSELVFSWCLRYLLTEDLQVHMARGIVQLSFKAALTRRQGCREPDPLYAHLQQLLLWCTVSSEWR